VKARVRWAPGRTSPRALRPSTVRSRRPTPVAGTARPATWNAQA
jgi:hypothetical protein